MSKKRDALRRGVRSLIDATSRELADLENRAPDGNHRAAAQAPRLVRDILPALAAPPARTLESLLPPPEPAPLDAPAPDEAPRLSPEVPLPAAEAVPPAGSDATAARVINEIEPAARAAEPAPSAVEPTVVRPPRDAGSAADVPWRFLDGTREGHRIIPAPTNGWPQAVDEAPAPLPPAPDAAGAVSPAPAIVLPPAPAVTGREAGGSGKQGRGTRRAQRRTDNRASTGTRGRVRPGRRERDREAAGDPVPDAVDPAQARGKTGVCFAYFINHACWRVPEAYCNKALQVCIVRQCPVYHLHRDSLEQRFAKKFKHLW